MSVHDVTADSVFGRLVWGEPSARRGLGLSQRREEHADRRPPEPV